MPKQLILLGDSIFDNKAYVRPGERDVVTHLRAKLDPSQWHCELWAVDGSVAGDVPSQLERGSVRPPAVFVLSAGGNDALGYLDLLHDPATESFGEVLVRLHGIRERFRVGYAATLDRILALGQPLIVCTVYNPRFPEELIQKAGETALSVFNDVIVQEALGRKLPIIDLRAVCTDDAHFANEIEPSEWGGEAIADAIIAAIT
jgi:GDSL-like Lipase/Acylhydrolase family